MINHRFLFAALIMCVMMTCLASAASPQKSQNVLLIVVDDLKPLMTCYGDKFAKTPNMDRLASRGVLFSNAYCQQAICGPSRASLLTGLRPDHTKVWDLQTKMRDVCPDILTLPQHFRNNGYQTAGIGKVFDPRCVDRQRDDPSWSRPFYKTSDDYYSPQTSQPGSHWQDPTTDRRIREAMAEAKRLNMGGAEGRAYVRKQCSPTTECIDVPDNTYLDGANVAHALDIMAELDAEDTPFFLAVGIAKPHLPFTAPKKYWDWYQRDELPLATFRENAADSPMIAYQSGGEIFKYTDIPELASFSDQKWGMLLPIEKQKELIHGYYAAVSYADALVGDLLDRVDELGLNDQTVIALVGDHGFHLGDHNIWCKHTNFEHATRSPLIISAPNLPPSTVDSPVELIDLFPSVTELAGLDRPDALDGNSLVSIMQDTELDSNDFAISQYPRGRSPGRTMGYSIRTNRYRYTIWMDGPWTSTQAFDPKQEIASELYDYQNDPQETINVVQSELYHKAADQMRSKLLTFLATQVETAETAAAP